MNILSISNLKRIGREKPLFENVTFGLNEGDKAALIGRNGTGKSTLLNTIAGVLTPDEGSVVLNKEAGISFLPQNPSYNMEDTIKEHIFKSSSPKLDLIKEYEDICRLLEKDSSDSVQKKFNEINEQMTQKDLWNYEAQVSSILTTLGIKDLDKKMKELSGGMIKKVALAQVLVEDTKLLLLDEPTNHLDITTIHWLQDYLAQTKRSVLMVTHDRYFLDAVCNHIYELSRNKVKLYTGNYSTYLEKKETEAEIEANTERRIESVLRFERDWLMRGPCARGTKAKARIQRDQALINREKFHDPKGFTFEVAGRRLGGKILELHNISKSFNLGKHTVIKDFNYTFSKGEKIGIFGDNGSGKSTLLNIITGTIEADSGYIEKGENTVIAYYQQNPTFKDLSITVLEYVKEAAEVMKMNDGTELSAALFLEQFGFEGKIQHSMLNTLSGGERKRLFLVRLLLSNPNFLILDEPTNDFDIFTMNILEQFLMGFKGCLLIVSHDRYFMDKVADTMFILEGDGNISGFAGKCSEYIEVREENKRQEFLEQKKAAAEKKEESKAQEKAAAQTQAKRKLTFKEQKEFSELEERIALLEDSLKEYEADMSSSDYEKSKAAGDKYTAAQTELEAAYARWEELAALV
ncbi:ABC-F family ATP-binding cassette domain-containing protein [Treponema sp.]|uniref:ABC-F family ATP-binding cassette domain-containing protein n=1 Tax=Treponema sp. TaxID=166 RepID=UPI0025CBF8F0|nr:ABC-F family ATP-binding cassette domain-containing protein [Treponema sp.]MCR5218925.1 ABC-F family ATP-binding cassette domain-containing protein [Treponema sp.]